MKGTFITLNWIKSNLELVQGIKNGYEPSNAIAGGNGSFLCTTPAQLNLTYKTEDGNVFTRDIISVVRSVNDWQKITQNRYEKLEETISNREFDVDKNGYITDIDNLVKI